jgi:hypothetical protein
MNRITYVDYSFQVVDDEIIFDEDLDGDQFMELHDIEEDTLYSISSIDGVLCFSKVYEDDEPEPDEEDWTGDNILAFVKH